MNINNLIEEITPLYNKYKINARTIKGTDALVIMWEIGDILRKFIENHNIAPHNLYRKVYGKSEGTNDIHQKSWITREFQGKCYRIRKIFETKNQIVKEFPNLKNFRAFREAMPFYDNVKYKLKPEEKEKLTAILNSDKNYKFILAYVRKLQGKKIGIKNPRTQKLAEMENEKKLFIDFYNSVYELTKTDQNTVIKKMDKDKIDTSLITFLAKNTNAFSQDGLKYFNLNTKIKTNNALWQSYFDMIIGFGTDTNAIKARRFRRLIPPERIAQLADMLYTLVRKIS